VDVVRVASWTRVSVCLCTRPSDVVEIRLIKHHSDRSQLSPCHSCCDSDMSKHPAKKKEGPKKNGNEFRYGESNPGLAGLMLYMRAADASHYTITDFMHFGRCIANLSATFRSHQMTQVLPARALPVRTWK
jgi:hypothetical protein